MSKHPYDNMRAIEYAKKWCNQKGNSCGVYLEGGNKSDCAHFLAHVLAAGGIVIKNPDPGSAFCKAGLAVRNTDIVMELRRLAGAFENIKKIDLNEAIVGDVGFLKLERPRHAFMICEIWNQASHPLSTPKVWAHSSARCCEEMDTWWRQWLSDAFRLEDG